MRIAHRAGPRYHGAASVTCVPDRADTFWRAMDKQELTDLLQAVDRRLASTCEVVLVGGAAMILHFGAGRTTLDVDVLALRGDKEDLIRAAAAVAQEHGLPPNWISDAVKGFADILPPDFQQRLTRLDLPVKQLHIYVLGLPEQVAMKIVALREQDLEDLELLLPGLSEAERDVVVSTMRHVAKFRPDWAQKMRYFLLERGWEID